MNNTSESLQGKTMTQQDIRAMAGGGVLNSVALNDVDIWTKYTRKTGLRLAGQRTYIKGTQILSPKNPKEILTNMQAGSRVAMNLNIGGDVGHNVVMQKIVQKTVTKINGSIVQKMIYYVMDPVRGGSIHSITERSIIDAYNVIYIYP